MSDTVIKVENLSKSYQIRHQNGERYTALRDVLSNGVKGMGNRLMGRTNGHTDTTREEFWALNDVSFEVKQGAPEGHPPLGTGFYPELTGRENIYLNGAILGMSRGEIRLLKPKNLARSLESKTAS